MARQGIISTQHVAMSVRGSKSSKPNIKTSRVVNVAPHVRMVHGKPVYVAGYTYRRKA